MLWTGATGYVCQFVRELAERYETTLVAFSPEGSQYRFDLHKLLPVEVSLLEWTPQQSDLDVETLINSEFDVVLCSGWHIPEYRKICHSLRGRSVRVVAFDTKLNFKPKQLAGAIAARLLGPRLFDSCFVPGKQQLRMANFLGYSAKSVMGLFACKPTDELRKWSPSSPFLFVGRFSPEKGLLELLRGYQQYRTAASHPRGLVVYGPEREELPSEICPGVEFRGFGDPDEIRQSMDCSHALIVPSLHERWGVVVLEACARALPVVATSAVGAVEDFSGSHMHLLKDLSAGSIAAELDAMDSLTEDTWIHQSASAFAAAQPFKLESWLERFEKVVFLGRDLQ